MTKDNKTYTYKQLLLALREQIIKNRILLKELNDLVEIEKNVGSYHFDDRLRDDVNDTYNIKLIIDEIQKRQSSLKKIFNKLTNYKFARASINKFQTYFVVNNNDEYNFELEHSYNLEKHYFGTIKITDKEKFNSIMSELNNSKLSNISEKGIHVDKNLYIGISSFIEIMSGLNSVHYVDSMDCINISLNDKNFEEILNTKISSDLLDDEVIELIETSSYNDSDIEFVEGKKRNNNYYKFIENEKKLVLEQKQ